MLRSLGGCAGVVAGLVIAARPAAADVEVGGVTIKPESRIIGLGTLETPADEITLDSLRVGLEAEAEPVKKRVRLDASVSVELSQGDVRLRDAYVGGEFVDRVTVRVGRHKRAWGAVERASRWRVITPTRGVISDAEFANDGTREEDQLPVGGRAWGATVGVKLTKRVDVFVAGYRGAVHEQVRRSEVGSGATLGLAEGNEFLVRAEAEVFQDMTVGAGVMRLPRLDQAGEAATLTSGLVGEVDFTSRHELIEVLAEAFIGDSAIHGQDDAALGTFWAVRGMVGIPRRINKHTVLMPLAGLGFFDAATDRDEDGGTTVEAGASLRLRDFGKWWPEFRFDGVFQHQALGDRLGGSRAGATVFAGIRFSP